MASRVEALSMERLQAEALKLEKLRAKEHAGLMELDREEEEDGPRCFALTAPTPTHFFFFFFDFLPDFPLCSTTGAGSGSGFSS